ncbi:hypothetical protein Tco_0203196 [Tanacetum coccineum]
MRKQQVLDLVLGGNQRVEFSILFVLDGFQLERHSPLAQQRLKVNPQMLVQMQISLTNVKANKLLMSVQASIPQGQKASDYDNSDPVPPRQNVVPSAEKTDSSQQELELLFHHHIAMLRTTGK